MGFERFNVVRVDPSKGTGVSVSLMRGRGKSVGMGVVRLQINLTNRVAEETGINIGCSVSLLLGNGADHGIIRIAPVFSKEEGTVLPSFRDLKNGVKFARIDLGHIPVFVNRSKKKQWCQWEPVEGGGIEIILPGWAEETAPKKKQVAAPIIRGGKVISAAAAKCQARLDQEDAAAAKALIEKNEENVSAAERGAIYK